MRKLGDFDDRSCPNQQEQIYFGQASRCIVLAIKHPSNAICPACRHLNRLQPRTPVKCLSKLSNQQPVGKTGFGDALA